MKRVLQVVFLALVVAGWGQAIWQHGQMPERVASHFNAAGTANGWMTRDEELGWQLGTITVVAALLQGIVLLQPKLPPEFVNVPHREYWFAPERRATSEAWISNLVLSVGCLLLLFFIGLFHLVYRANLTSKPQLPPIVGPLGVLLLLASLSIIATTVLRFARKPAA